jgi:SpoVK/Ycf46/Vps4 family AAA+-type ATPase
MVILPLSRPELYQKYGRKSGGGVMLYGPPGAMLRPGRFDRVIFVPPPDEPARADILSVLLKAVPSAGLDLKALACQTPMFSGADLRALVERSVDRVIDEALTTGGEPPVSMTHLTESLSQVTPSTLDWLHRVQAYVEFANHTERYDDVAKYLRTRDVRRRLGK